jgi:uncharacterized protein YegL
MVNNKSLIVIVLDRSGSMSSIRDDTIGGINTFLADQQKLPGECNLTFTQFDDVYEIIHHSVPLDKIKPLDQTTFVPRGATALLDAIGRTINTVGAELTALPEDQRPGKVFFTIFTDGEENSSKEFSKDQVFEMIKKQREEYKWEFIFLAANQDAIQTGQSMGMGASSSMTCNSTSAGIKGTYDALSKKLGDVRLSRSSTVDFDDNDRSSASL